MKDVLKIVILVMWFLSFSACTLSTSGNIEGRWLSVRTYNSGTWNIPDKSEGVEFRGDGKLLRIRNGETIDRGETYTLDDRSNPARIVLVSGTNRTYGLFKFEGAKLILKFNEPLKEQFPSDLGIEPNFVVMEMERGN